MKEKLNIDLKNAMKNQNKEMLNVLRMVKGAIQMEEIKLKRDLTEEELINVISKQIKSRKESIVEFTKGNREDLVQKTTKEIDILINYMPKQMTEEEIIKEIDKLFQTLKPTPKDIGLVMKEISIVLKGKADMGLVNKLIKEKLETM